MKSADHGPGSLVNLVMAAIGKDDAPESLGLRSCVLHSDEIIYLEKLTEPTVCIFLWRCLP